MKIFSSITTILILIVAIWLYLNRELCGEHPWWIVLVLGLINLGVFLILIFNKRFNKK